MTSLGGFGDSIMATPLFVALRDKYKDAHITALTMWETSALAVRHLNSCDEVVSHNFFQEPFLQSLSLCRRLRSEKFDLSIAVYPSNRAHYNILLAIINADFRLGHDYRIGNPLLYGRFLLTDLVEQGKGTHNVQENINLAQALGINISDPLLSVGSLGKSFKTWSRKFLKGSTSPCLGIHPGCSPLKNHKNRRWPAEKYAKLAKLLVKETGCRVLVFLGPDEAQLKEVFQKFSPDAIIVSEKRFEEVATLIRCCRLLVCNDSSLGHLAAACHVPVVSIFGPINPDYTHPWGVEHRVVESQLECSPCFEVSRRPLLCHRGLDFACVRDIPVSQVLGACMDLMSECEHEMIWNHSFGGTEAKKYHLITEDCKNRAK